MNSSKERTEVLKYILNTRFFEHFKSGKGLMPVFEVQITPECNLKCDYCYLKNFGDSIYPKNIRNHKDILNNLNIVIDWIIENDFHFNQFSLFSGEIWHTQFGLDVLDVIYNKLTEYKFCNFISIPSNSTFIVSDEQLSKIEERIDRFNKLGVRLAFSLSLDGLIIEDTARPFVSSKITFVRDQAFYDKVFEFAKKHDYGFHPMVAAVSIEKWSYNFDWWCHQFKKHGIEHPWGNIMMLEVRNDNWTQDKIEEYLKFLDHDIDYKYEIYCDKDKEKMCQLVIGNKRSAHIYNEISPIQSSENQFSCLVQSSFYVRLGDLAITPCHRTSYDKFNYGKFVVKDNKIVDIEANNVEFAINVLMGSVNAIQYKCGSCKYTDFCAKGCLGAQYESSGEIFYPCKTVCNLYQSKIDFLIDKYREMNIFTLSDEQLEKQDNYFVNRYNKVKRLIEMGV